MILKRIFDALRSRDLHRKKKAQQLTRNACHNGDAFDMNENQFCLLTLQKRTSKDDEI